ncbi:MAG TPA: PilN domain-containing protein [Syntrophothermus lipocalidus]|nr:PilN domain-containing protein [Syntrophothermus lipocalidus]
METDARINLLASPLKTRLWTNTWFWTALMVVVAYGVMIAMGYSIYQTRQQAQERNALLLESIRRQENVSLVVPDIAASQKVVKEKALKIRKLEESRVLMTKVLLRVEKLLPAGTCLSELSIDENSVDVKGLGPGYAAVAQVLKGLTEQSFFKEAELVRCEETEDGGVSFHIQVQLSSSIRESDR